MTDGDHRESALTLLLERRPDTLAEAAEMLGTDGPSTLALIESLVADHRIDWNGATLAYPNPGMRAAAAGRERIGAAIEALAALQSELDALTHRVDDWAAGLAARGRTESVLRLADLDDIDELWRHRYASRTTGRMSFMVPDIRLTGEMTAARHGASDEFIRDHALDVQVLWAARDVDTPAQRAAARAYLVEGAEYRVHPRVEHWLVATEKAVIVRSADRGFVAVRDPTVVSVILELFDTVWSRSVAFDAVAGDGDALLAALGTGLTVEAAARVIGISPRTAQRRLSELMVDHGASSLFSLGAAWERRGGSR